MLIAEIGRVKQGAAPVIQEDSNGVTASLDKIMATMGVLSLTCPLMGQSYGLFCETLVANPAFPYCRLASCGDSPSSRSS